MSKLPLVGKSKHLALLALLVTLIIPLILVIMGIVIFNKTNPEVKISLEKVKDEVSLTPSQVLSNKSKYDQQEIIVRGRISLLPVVCEKKECPANDSCCGCPTGRDIILTDAGKVLTSQEGILRLLGDGGSLCQRRLYSCEYNCGDWSNGSIYNVSGKFYAELPPPGWKLSLNYYFQVKSKNLVEKVNLSEVFGEIISEIINKIASFKTSGQYILP